MLLRMPFARLTLAAIDVSQLCSCIAIIRQVNLYMMLMLLMQLIKIAGNDIVAAEDM